MFMDRQSGSDPREAEDTHRSSGRSLGDTSAVLSAIDTRDVPRPSFAATQTVLGESSYLEDVP